MSAKKITLRLSGLTVAAALGLLMPLSIRSGDTAEVALMPIEVSDLCAVQGTCGPMQNHTCMQADGTMIINAYCSSGCGDGGPPPWGGGGGGRP